MGQPLFIYFWSFQTNIKTILQQINVKKCPSSIRRQDSNLRPFEYLCLLKFRQLTFYKDVFIFPPMEEDRMEMVPTATTTTSDDVIGIRYNRQIVSLISNLNVCILCN